MDGILKVKNVCLKYIMLLSLLCACVTGVNHYVWVPACCLIVRMFACRNRFVYGEFVFSSRVFFGDNIVWILLIYFNEIVTEIFGRLIS